MSNAVANILLVIVCIGTMWVFFVMSADYKEHKLQRVLRLLILAEVVFGLLWVVATFLLKSSLPPELQSFAAARKNREWGLGDWLGLGGFLFLVVGWIGLWRLWWRARAIYTAGWLLGIVAAPFMGPHVHSGPPEAAALISTLAAGLILGMIYFSDLRHSFSRARAEAPAAAA